MAIGLKKNETRSWFTQRRGDLTICSSKKLLKPQEVPDRVAFWLWANRHHFPGYHGNFADLLASLPRGKALCIVNLLDCLPTNRLHVVEPEIDLGNYMPDRY